MVYNVIYLLNLLVFVMIHYVKGILILSSLLALFINSLCILVGCLFLIIASFMRCLRGGLRGNLGLCLLLVISLFSIVFDQQHTD